MKTRTVEKRRTARSPAKTRKKVRMVSPARKAAHGNMPARRADCGAPITGFFARQSATQRTILETPRQLVEEAAPDATASIKWGMPFYSIGRTMMCALDAFKSHVNLILSGPPGAFDDPDGLLEGEGKTGRHLKLRTPDELPRDAVRGWLRTAAQVARKQARR